MKRKLDVFINCILDRNSLLAKHMHKQDMTLTSTTLLLLTSAPNGTEDYF